MVILMAYRIDATYCWYNKGSMIVKMYFINHIPFTFDELPAISIEDPELISIADTKLLFI